MMPNNALRGPVINSGRRLDVWILRNCSRSIHRELAHTCCSQLPLWLVRPSTLQINGNGHCAAIESHPLDKRPRRVVGY